MIQSEEYDRSDLESERSAAVVWLYGSGIIEIQNRKKQEKKMIESCF